MSLRCDQPAGGANDVNETVIVAHRENERSPPAFCSTT